ncbi:unnamed protein product [Chondrus crispus]|uniref:Uncharacterized protein n=1 Tax=Chondrus crispus TaxID=2769 RepID=R7QQN2_CHOCR|nr:unnamed protein product [Chondrus crispus]CDF39695.1 unnamed protein product [Chondrus crispus]|eukprot:XP_005709989.1 unnamed protein product [Chondrus crispus]
MTEKIYDTRPHRQQFVTSFQATDGYLPFRLLPPPLKRCAPATPSSPPRAPLHPSAIKRLSAFPAPNPPFPSQNPKGSPRFLHGTQPQTSAIVCTSSTTAASSSHHHTLVPPHVACCTPAAFTHLTFASRPSVHQLSPHSPYSRLFSCHHGCPEVLPLHQRALPSHQHQALSLRCPPYPQSLPRHERHCS